MSSRSWTGSTNATATAGSRRYFRAAARIREIRRRQGAVTSIASGHHLGSDAIGTAAAGACLPPARTCCVPNLHYPYSLPNNSVWSIFPDPDGGIWVGTYGGKLAYMTLRGQRRGLFQSHAGRAEPSHRQLFRRGFDEGNLWIGTEGGGINRWDRPQRPVRLLHAGEPLRPDVEHDQKAAATTETDRLLVSAFNGGMRVVRRTAGTFLRPVHEPSGLADSR